jgi:dephospho-CoA kinase
MKVIGLTGSIAMGKTVTAAMFADAGVSVFNSDAAVHALYSEGGAGVAVLRRLCPGVIVDGAVDRTRLREAVVRDPALLERIEREIHPLVREAEQAFLEAERARGARLALIDIPLLYETGRESDFDAVVVVSAPADVQRARALARPGMTSERLDLIMERQLPDSEKRKRAHFVVDTGQGLDHARRQVEAIVARLRSGNSPPPCGEGN